jgi:hypothetical protein
MNKKGAIGIIIFFLVILFVLVFGFIAAITWSAVDIVSDEVTPIMEGLGMIDNVNVSQGAEMSFGILDTAVQSFPWLIAFGYIMALIFTLVFVFLVGYNPHPAFIGLYFALMILLIFGCIIMSNVYQDIYTGTDDIATRLQEQGILSYMILHSPFIMAMVAVVGGILMFARQASTEGGGFGI